MKIVCPNCATSYEVQAAAFSGGERSVRCARCRTVWVAAAPGPDMDVAGAPADEVAAFGADPTTPGLGTVAFYDPMPSMENTDEAASDAAAHDMASEGADARAGQALADAADRHDSQQAAENAEALPQPSDAPPLAPETPEAMAATSEKPVAARKPSEDIETFAARRARREALRRRHNWFKPNLQNAIIVLLVMVSVLIGWRNDVVRMMPQTASFFSTIGLKVNLRGLTFADVKTTREQHDGVNVLVVEGRIVSEVPKPVHVPRLRFAVRNNVGHEVYAWTALPARSILPPGESLPFRSRLASPPPDTRTVLVRFFNRRDIVAGTQ